MIGRCQQAFPNVAQEPKGVVPFSAPCGVAISPAEGAHHEEAPSAM
jgi:hypothetical protein